MSTEQHFLIANLCQHDKLRITKIGSLLQHFNKEIVVEELIASLIATELVYVEGYNELRLLTDHCKCYHIGNKKFVAADDKTGRLTRWLIKKGLPI